MKTVRTKVYQFSELSKPAQKTAILEMDGINTMGEWWQDMCEDAKNVGLEITSFDIQSGKIKGSFITSAGEVVETILTDHGADCDTYKTALRYKHAFQLNSRETNEDELSEMEDNFLDAILADYLKMLEEDLNYRESEEAIIEMIEANEYEFTQNGKRFHK